MEHTLSIRYCSSGIGYSNGMLVVKCVVYLKMYCYTLFNFSQFHKRRLGEGRCW